MLLAHNGWVAGLHSISLTSATLDQKVEQAAQPWNDSLDPATTWEQRPQLQVRT